MGERSEMLTDDNLRHQKAFNSEKATVVPDVTLAYPDLAKPVEITQIPHMVTGICDNPKIENRSHSSAGNCWGTKHGTV